MIVDEEGQKVEWNGNFPETLKCNLETDFDMLKTYPLVCLNLVLNQQKENAEGLRPFEEIENCVKGSVTVKLTDPFLEYQKGKKIG